MIAPSSRHASSVAHRAAVDATSGSVAAVDDRELLRRYAGEESEPAFAELVHRHLDLVYSAALRRLGGDAHAAADVAQQVFAALARQATALTRCAVLPGWLYATTRNMAVDVVRTEQCRRARELEAHTMHELNSPPPPDAAWEHLRSLLDAAMAELSDRDREVVLLRFFARRPFGEIGAALNLSEDAARMRVERALDKLHALLAKRGVTSTASALGVALASQAAATAPAGLAASIAGSAVGGAAVAGAGAMAALIAFMTASKLTVSVAVAGALATGFAVYQSSQASTAATELAQVRGDRAALAARLAELETSVTVAEKELADREAALERARLDRASELAAAARRAAAAEEKTQRDRALQQFLNNDPELKKLRFEANRASILAGNPRREVSPEQREQGATRYAQTKEIQAAAKAVGIESAPPASYDNWQAGQVVKDLSIGLFHADSSFSEQQANQLQSILSTARISMDQSLSRDARFDWDRVLKAAEPILSPAQLQGLRSMAANGRNEVMLATLVREAAAAVKK